MPRRLLRAVMPSGNPRAPGYTFSVEDVVWAMTVLPTTPIASVPSLGVLITLMFNPYTTVAINEDIRLAQFLENTLAGVSSSDSTGTTVTGTGMDAPGQAPTSTANYSLVNNNDGTFVLSYDNGAVFYYSSTLQQWSVPSSNGGITVYSRDTNAGVSFGDWMVQQVNASGAITSTTTLSGAIPGESLTISKGTSSNPFITGTGETTAIPSGMSIAEAMAYFEATGTPISFNDQTANVANGNCQTFTIYASSASSTAQTIQLALSGGSGNNIIVMDLSLDDVANDASYATQSEWRMVA